MNCDWVQENITLYLYNELADDARHELEQHVARCKACAAEMADQQQFQTQLSALPVIDPSPSFLAAARMRLQESLESIEPHRLVAPDSLLARIGDNHLPAWFRRWHRHDVSRSQPGQNRPASFSARETH